MRHGAILLAALLMLVTAATRSASSQVHEGRDSTVVSLRDNHGLLTVIEEVPVSRVASRPPWHNARPVGQSGQWQLYSAVEDDAVVIWHVPVRRDAIVSAPGNPAGSSAAALPAPALPVLKSRWSLPEKAQASVHGPSWWPVLNRPWLRRSKTPDGRVTTLLGWYHGAIASAHRMLTNAARTGGLRLVRHLPASGDTGHGASSLLIFAGLRSELVITLADEGGRVGVVAHLVEGGSKK